MKHGSYLITIKAAGSWMKNSIAWIRLVVASIRQLPEIPMVPTTRLLILFPVCFVLAVWMSIGFPGDVSAQEAQEKPTKSVIKRDSELQTISTEFEMADGPSWDGWSLTIPDVKGETLFRYIPKTKTMQTLLPKAGRISASFYNHGRLFLSDSPGGEIEFLDGKNQVSITNFAGLKQEGEKPYRPNDLVVDKFGGMYVTFTPQNKVIYVSPTGKQVVAVENVNTPNGITISPDESTLYVSSFVPKKIWAYDIDSPGKTSNGKELAAMDDGPDRGADGMTIDRAGNIYCAGPKDIWIWSPSGKLIDKIACPTKPINCTFGDQDMRTLYITGPGGLYAQRMKVSGRSPQPPSLELQPPAKFPPKTKASQPSTKITADVEPYLDVVYASYADRKMLADIFVPKQANAKNLRPAVVVVHGGGWHSGDKTKFRALAVALAQRGFVTASIEYRLAEEAAFPAAIHDCHAAVRFLRANSEKYHLHPDKIGAVGGSAGGHLTGLMAAGGGNEVLLGNGGNPDQSSRIQASIVMAGPLQMVTGSVAERSLKPGAKSNSNLWLRGNVEEKQALYRLADAHVQIDKSTCPILFMVGEHDNPPRNQPSRDRLTELGIETGLKTYKDGKHGCWNRLPWFNAMVEDMDQFLSKHLK